MREAYSKNGTVRVRLYAGSIGGTVQVRRGEHWGIARPGEVANHLIVELTIRAVQGGGG